MTNNIELEIQNRVKNGQSRLEAISNMNLGIRSEAAKRCLEKREYRKFLMDFGMSHKDACIVVNKKFNQF